MNREQKNLFDKMMNTYYNVDEAPPYRLDF